MLQIKDYMKKLQENLEERFGKRFLYLGLQGSYMRGEADKDSDIDVMLVLEDFSVEDMDNYREIILSLGCQDKACGFICGKKELLNWNPYEICHLIYSTEDYYGNLKTLVPDYTKRDIYQYIKVLTGNLYHEICHRYLYSDKKKNAEELKYSYKSVFYILQNIEYFRTGNFIKTKKEMLKVLKGMDYKVFDNSIKIKNQGSSNFIEEYQLLFYWCQNILAEF